VRQTRISTLTRSVKHKMCLVDEPLPYRYGKGRVADNVSVVHDVPEPGKARRRHVRRLNCAKLLGTIGGGKAARTRGRCVK